MESHWEQSMEWDKMDADPEEIGHRQPQRSGMSPGSYHCKSALRDHESNMKLYLYKSSYKALSAAVGNFPYNDEALLLLPDIWRCFYSGDHDLRREFDPTGSKAHSTGSSAFLRWADYTMAALMTPGILSDILKAEGPMWQIPHLSGEEIHDTLIIPVMQRMKRVLYLQYFLNLALVVLNYEPSECRSDVNVLVPGVCTLYDGSIYKLIFNDHLSLQITGQAICVITPIFHQILQKDLFLNLCDKISERINVIMGAKAILGITKLRFPDQPSHPDLLLEEKVKEIITWGDNVLYTHRNRAYDLISSYEALCVSSILTHDDPLIWDNFEFQNNLLADIRMNSPDLYSSAISLLEITNGMPPHLLSEVHGLWRIWGHPIIDLEGGLKKMETTCLKQAKVDEKETTVGVRTFKSIFSKNYKDKHSHYPLSNMTSPQLYDLYSDHLSQRDKDIFRSSAEHYNSKIYVHQCLREEVPINEFDSRYRHSDWDDVVFLQSFQIPQSVNLATMIKDKAISQTRSELISSIMTRHSVFDSNNRRGVIKWLSEQTLRLKGFLTSVDQEGIPDNDCIIGLYPKERELKTKARFFSLMSYQMRMYVTATEELIGKYLLPYFPMITMSDTLLNMIMRLYNMTTKIGASGSSVTYSMNIDFSKWNQNMRERTNLGIFDNIDRVLGFRRLISRTHSIFKSSYLYLCSGEYIPDIMRGQLTTLSPYSRIGDESGKEGLRQKGWTITTVCDIFSLAFSHGVRIELIGGGDNQVLTVTISDRNQVKGRSSSEQRIQIRDRMVRFRNSLAKKMDKRGLPLKLEETWISHRLLMYNKIMYLDGVPLPGRLKVISRLFSNSNEGLTSLGNITSVLGTGYQSLSSKDYDPVLSWILSRWLTLINMALYYTCNPMSGTARIDRSMIKAYGRIAEKEGIFGPLPEESLCSVSYRKEKITFIPKKILSLEDLYLICLYYHKILGGPGIGTPLSYMMKGFPDPLSESLSFNYFIIKSRLPSAIKERIINLTSVEPSSTMHWEHLLEDPVSINHSAPSHGIAALRSQASQVMKHATIKNTAFRELISIGDTDYLRDLSAKLCSPPTIEPRLLHDIVGSTIPGYVNTILSKVDQSTTLNKLAADTDVVGQVYKSEMLYLMYLANKIKVRKGHTIGNCPTVDAKELRNLTWRKKIVGVTTPHPFAYLSLIEHSDMSLACDHNYISTLVKRSHHLSDGRRGQFRPYFGSYTAEKFKSGVLASAYGDEDILRRALKIQKLLGWRYQEGSNMYTLIQGILSCVTDADPSKFLPTVEEITGDVEHRYHDMATKHGGIPSNLVRDLTHVSCNTSTFIDHSKGAANESLHFQAAIIYSCVMASLRSGHKESLTRVFHFHESCSTCIMKVDNVQDDGEYLSDIQLASCPTNPLMYIAEEEIPIHYHNQVAFARDQEKQRQNEKKSDIQKLTMEENLDRDRGSWLLLAMASLIKGTLKRSAVALLINKMSINELVSTLRYTIYSNMIKRGRPLGAMSLCDIQDVIIEHEGMLRAVISAPTMMGHFTEIGIPVVSKEDSLPVILQALIGAEVDTSMNLLEHAVCKYQDPEYKISRVITVCYRIPQLATCSSCVKYWYRWATNKDEDRCANHIVTEPDMRYHLFSIDKLSRNPGLAKSPDDQEVGLKRRSGSLFASIKRYKLSNTSRITRTRLMKFLYHTSPVEDKIRSALCTTWERTNITDSEKLLSDPISIGEHILSLPDDSFEYLPDSVGQVINLVQCVMSVVCGLRTGGGILRLGLDVLPDHARAGIVRKGLYIIKRIVQSASIQCEIVLLYTECSDLEDSRLYILKELAYDVEHYVPAGLGMTGRLKVVCLGETSLEILGVAESCSAVLLRGDPGTLILGAERRCSFFLMTNSHECYKQIADIKEAAQVMGKNNITYHLHTPSETSASPFAVMIEVSKATGPGYLSYIKIIDKINHTKPSYSNEMAGILSELESEGNTDSLSYSLYSEYVSSTTGIISEGDYNRVKSRLSAGLFMFTLKSNRVTPMSWRVRKLITILICLEIMTATNAQELLILYSKITGASFSPKTYKEVILYYGPYSVRYRGLVNYTSGSLGQEVISTYTALRERVYCTWTTQRVRCSRLHL